LFRRSWDRVNPMARRNSSASAAENLFLEEDNAQCPLQDRLRPGIRIGHFLVSTAAGEVGVDGIPLNRPWPDDRDLDGDVIERLRPHPRQGGHLGAGFDLEDTHGVGRLDQLDGLRIVPGNLRQIDRFSPFGANGQRIL